VSSRKTAPKPRQVTKSEVVRDDFFDSSLIVTLEDELNYIRSQIKAVKGTSNFDDVISDSLREVAERLTNSEGYFHTQSVASSIWTIVHSLNRYPNIIIFDTSYNQIFAKVKMLNVNTARVTFSEPVAGTALLK
jgi:hypothetical protein